jgi:hypothetical protein
MTSANNGSDIQVHGGSLQPLPYVIDPHSQKEGIQGQPGQGGSGGTAVVAGFAGDFLHFVAFPNNASVSAFLWQFNNDASISTSTDSNPVISYGTDGIKTGTLTLFNTYGCSNTSNFWIQIISCNPTIPKDAQIVKSSTSGGAGVIWVQAGGNYTLDNEPGDYCTIFVEPGGSVVTTYDYVGGPIYVRAGGSITLGSDQYRLVVLEKPTVLTTDGSHYADTFYCDNLTFDYSQVQSSVADIPAPTLSLIQTGDHLFANTEEAPAEIRIMNILGAEVLSQHGVGELDVDLSPLPAGVYFAQVQSGDAREVKKIAVMH